MATEEVRSKRFVLEDEQGKCRAKLGFSDDGIPGLVFFNKEETRQAEFSLGEYPQIYLFDSKGKSCIALHLNKHGQCLIFADQNLNPHVVVGMIDGKPVIAKNFSSSNIMGPDNNQKGTPEPRSPK